jgi:hypothetical protein
MSMHPLADALPDHMDALALRQACGEIEAGLRAEVERLRDTLHGIASWSEGPEVTAAFDEPWAAKLARAALTPAEVTK